MAHSTKAFRTLLDQCWRRHGGRKQDFARALGITPWAFSNLRSGQLEPSVVLLLRMADLCSLPPRALLTAGGYSATAATIERLYGPAAQRTRQAGDISPYERELVAQWRRLDARDLAILALLLKRPVPATRRHRRADDRLRVAG